MLPDPMLSKEIDSSKGELLVADTVQSVEPTPYMLKKNLMLLIIYFDPFY